ncbi:MAG: YbaN family protein [Clostridiales bacterium]|nr:YbaN family protein [Clostridiales bacterium]
MIKKSLYIIAGSITFVLALIGIVVRGIPTTPLLLATLYLYSKGSAKLERRFRSSVFYRKFVQKYDQRKALTLKEKISIQVFAAVMMALSFILINITVVRVILMLCFFAMNYVFIFKIKTYRPEQEEIAPKVD